MTLILSDTESRDLASILTAVLSADLTILGWSVSQKALMQRILAQTQKETRRVSRE